MQALLDQVSHQCSKLVTESYSTSFSLATRMLSNEIRQDIYNIYGMDEATKALGHSAAIMLRHYRAMQTKEETQLWLQLID